MLAHEADVVVNLHHHAAGVQNIRNLVHVILDLTDDNYKCWRDQLLLVTGKYSLEDHILQDTPAPGFPDWRRMDCVVKSWISGTISADLAEAVMSRDATARGVWLALEEQFLGNQETRALHLDAKFRHFCQGDLSITDYCKRFKNMADALGELGGPVTDRALVLNVIRDLADRFEAVGRHLRLSRDVPTFLEVRSVLILEELTMDQRPSSTSTALLASGDKQPAGSRSFSSSRPPAKQQQQSNSGNKDSSARGSSQRAPSDRHSKRAGKGSQQPGSQSSSHGAPSSNASPGGAGTPWPLLQNPWTGAIHMWPGQRAPSLTPQQQQALLAHQQALLVQQAQQQAAYANPAALAQHQALLAHQQAVQAAGQYTSVPGWDQQSLASAFSTVSLNQPQQSDWYFNSGATSHMTSDAGTLSSTSVPCFPAPSSIVVGNGSFLPVTATGAAVLSPSLRLNNVLVSPQLIKNLISVRQFTIDNKCSVEFDPSGCSVKDLLTRNVIARCNSSGSLYPLRLPPAAHALVAGSTSSLWHRRLDHPGHEALSKLSPVIPGCNKDDAPSVCHACQLGRHIRLPFHASSTRAINNFDLIHCDLWTSPVISVSSYKYYLVIRLHQRSSIDDLHGVSVQPERRWHRRSDCGGGGVMLASCIGLALG
jgi:hypothetical protein